MGDASVPKNCSRHLAMGDTDSNTHLNTSNAVDLVAMKETQDVKVQPPMASCYVPVTSTVETVGFDGHTTQTPYRLTWEGITYTPNANTTIIDNVSGWAEPGELLAIMGPSGAGKSTMLDILADRLKKGTWSGALQVNGSAVDGRYRHTASYCMQDDALHAALTVFENILFSALLHLPGTPAAEVRRRVDAIVGEFGLERVRNSKIGNAIIRGVSGGERRRVSIACELVGDPGIVFLDEPTSGLDSVAAHQVCVVLRGLARRRGKTVVATIHQPSTDTFTQFDRLLLLAGGRTVYFGPRAAATDYFAEVGNPVPTYSNPADHYLTLLNTDFAHENDDGNKKLVLEKLVVAYRNSVASQLQSAPAGGCTEGGAAVTNDTLVKASSVRQTGILLHRMVLDAWRNVGVYWVRLAMYIGMALLMGAAWWHVGTDQTAVANRLSSHFFAVAFLCFMAVAAVPAFIEEHATYKRERANGAYGAGPYVVANLLVSLPFVLLIATAFTAIAYPMVQLTPGAGPFFTYVLFLYLALLAAEGMTVCISALLPNFIVALAIAAFANGFFMVMGGFLVQTESLPRWLQWANYISYQKWPFEAIVHNDFVTQTFQCAPTGASTNGSAACSCIYPPSQSNPCVSNGDDVLRALGYEGVEMWKWALIMVAFSAFWRVAFYLLLKFHVGHRR